MTLEELHERFAEMETDGLDAATEDGHEDEDEVAEDEARDKDDDDGDISKMHKVVKVNFSRLYASIIIPKKS